jgi:hypothetical protein
VERAFRGAAYEITIENPSGEGTKVASAELDGHPLEGTLVPPADDRGRHAIRVRMA